MGTFALTAQSMTPKDSQFAMDAAQAGMLEIKLAELAVTNANADNVKKHAQMIVNDHTKANIQLQNISEAKNLTWPTRLTTDGQKAYYDMSLKKGADFDKAYSKMMLEEHEKAILLFKGESQSGSDKEIRDFASVTLPILDHHLMMAKDLDVAINSSRN